MCAKSSKTATTKIRPFFKFFSQSILDNAFTPAVSTSSILSEMETKMKRFHFRSHNGGSRQAEKKPLDAAESIVFGVDVRGRKLPSICICAARQLRVSSRMLSLGSFRKLIGISSSMMQDISQLPLLAGVRVTKQLRRAFSKLLQSFPLSLMSSYESSVL